MTEKRSWTKGTEDAVGTVRVTFALYAPDGTRVRGNRQRSIVVNFARVSDVHATALEAFGNMARAAHNAKRFGGEKND